MENTDNYVQDEAVVNNMFFAQQVSGGGSGGWHDGGGNWCGDIRAVVPWYETMKVGKGCLEKNTSNNECIQHNNGGGYPVSCAHQKNYSVVVFSLSRS